MEAALIALYIPGLVALVFVLGATVMIVRDAARAGIATPRRTIAAAALTTWTGAIIVVVWPDPRPWLQSINLSIWALLSAEALALWIVGIPPRPRQGTQTTPAGQPYTHDTQAHTPPPVEQQPAAGARSRHIRARYASRTRRID